MTADRMVQQTRFANGCSATVNFSATDTWDAPNGTALGPRSFRTETTPPR